MVQMTATDDYDDIARRARQLRRRAHEYAPTAADDYCVNCGHARGYIEAHGEEYGIAYCDPSSGR